MRSVLLQRWRQWIKTNLPLTWYGFLFVCVMVFGAIILHLATQKADENVLLILHLCEKIIVYVIAVVLAFSLLSTMIPWFLLRAHRKAITVSLLQQISKGADLYQIELELLPKIKAHALCLLRSEWIDSNEQYHSEMNALVEHSTFQFSQKKIVYTSQVKLPYIKDYHIDQGIIYIEDFLHLFSFAVKISTNFQLQRLPEKTKVKELNVSPRKADIADKRTESSQMAQGDLYQFKHFEDNDDVRRIVWSVYARSGELVVRTPEIKSEFASDIVLYCSFYSHYSDKYFPLLDSVYLNVYKNILWSYYAELVEKEKDSKVIVMTDGSNNELSSKDEVEKVFTHASWQKIQILPSQKEKNKISVWLISSLIPVEEVERLSMELPDSVRIVQIKLTEIIDQLPSRLLLPSIFLETEKIPEYKNKWEWQWSSVRKQLEANETAIENILSTRLTKISV